MEKVKFESLNEAVVFVSNSVDADKVYDITANVRISNSVVNTFDGGTVKKDNKVLCSFSAYNKGNLNTNFQGGLDITTMCSVLNAIDIFIDDVEVKVASGTVVVIN